MDSQKTTELAIKRHDIDAPHFQHTYSQEQNSPQQTKHEAVFLYGRRLVLDELHLLLDKLPAGSRILDVGCGTGHLTQWIKEKNFEVCAIEPSSEMLSYAKKNFPNLEIQQAISSKIPYPANHFDLVVAFEVLRYLDATENMLTYQEFARVLKPGGRFFVTQVNKFATDFYFFFHNIKSVYCRLTGKIHHHCNFTTPGRQAALVKAAGFQQVTTIGRFEASIRLSYKVGKKFGQAYARLIDRISVKQRFANSYKNFAGHLVVIGTK